MSNIQTADQVDELFVSIKADFDQSIDQYTKTSESFWVGWAVDMEQKIVVNGQVKTADIDDSSISADMTVCPLDGKLTIVHSFEAQEFIPIANTPFRIQAYKKEKMDLSIAAMSYRQVPTGAPFDGVIGADGTKEVTLPKSFRGKPLKISFEPDVTEQDVKALFDSYDPLLDKFSNWLEEESKELKTQWLEYLNDPINITDAITDFLEDMVDAVIDAWDEIAKLFDLLSKPKELADALSKFVSNPEKISEMLASSKEEAAKMFTLLKDEARCFLCLKAVYCWFCMLNPAQIAKAVSTTLASILVEVVINFLIPGGAVLKNVTRLRDVAGATSGVEL